MSHVHHVHASHDEKDKQELRGPPRPGDHSLEARPSEPLGIAPFDTERQRMSNQNLMRPPPDRPPSFRLTFLLRRFTFQVSPSWNNIPWRSFKNAYSSFARAILKAQNQMAEVV